MLKKISLLVSSVVFILQTTKAQVYQIDQLKEIPYIDDSCMNIISKSIWLKYKDAALYSKKHSTSRSASETVFGYYDTRHDGQLHKVNPINGTIFSDTDITDLKINNRLLFNLTFNSDGKLVIPTVLNVISYRMSKGDFGEPIALISFEIVLSDSLKQELSKVSLKRLAKIDINSINGSLKPVAIQLPFNLSDKKMIRLERVYGKINTERHNKTEPFNFSFTQAWVSTMIKGEQPTNGSDPLEVSSGLKEEIVNAIKANTNLLTYKSGTFDFTIEKEIGFDNYTIDINIFRDSMIYSSEHQKKSFEVNSGEVKYNVIKFEGTGKKQK